MKSVKKHLTHKKNYFPVSSFPNGWFHVAYSSEIEPGEVKPLYYFGKDLVLFRTESGIPNVFDAYCPHIGAHIGYGGKVKGEGIQCPFHGWCFDGNGHCTDVPYINKLPPNTQIRKWLVKEINGIIMLYYHPERKLPTWEVPNLSNYINNDNVSFNHVKRWKLGTHPQEMSEHCHDLGHINLHTEASHAKSENVHFDGPMAVHRFSTQYRPSTSVAWIIGEQVELKSEVKSYGLGFTFILHSLEGKVRSQWSNIVLATPIDAQYSEIHLLLGMPKVFNKYLTRTLEILFRNELKKGFELSLSLLENKNYCTLFPLCKDDFLIANFQSWSCQFYS